jgi:hypothetical protein
MNIGNFYRSFLGGRTTSIRGNVMTANRKSGQLDWKCLPPSAWLNIFFSLSLLPSHALLRKFLKIQILAAEGLKLSACLLLHLHFS